MHKLLINLIQILKHEKNKIEQMDQ